MSMRRSLAWTVAVLTAGLLVSSLALANELKPLQPLLDAAKPGSTLVLEPGRYRGPVVLDKSLTLEGNGKATIDAGGRGTVLLVDTDGATISGLHLVGSGTSHNDLDSGIQVRGKYNVVKDNVIEDALFGVDLQQSNNNIVRRNRISSKDIELGMRGDAIRLWYSYDNRIIDNVVTNSRDIVIWYSRDNTISRNTASGGRYSLHFMYSQYNLVEDNTFFDNSVGIFVMYSDGVVLRNNHIRNATGTTGVGIGFKETSDLVVENNQILYCANGLYIDVSPYQPDTINVFNNNVIAYNGIGISFLSDWHGNEFRNNHFKGNLTQVAVNGGGTATRHVWENNYWDNYEGFDRDNDGIGDTPHEMHAYADRLWMDVPPTQFFKSSPLLEVLDFLERLAPFSPPKLLLRDAIPMIKVKSES
jgi:nitrous oxidase accessory protein